jgi:hypothetical protein
MTFRFQKRRGIGNVITTLIILIASVVLGAGVIFFGGSMFQSNTQSESIKVTNIHSWVDGTTGNATTAFVVQNTGSKATTISSVNLRGLSVPTAEWNYMITSDATVLQTELPVLYSITAGDDNGFNPSDSATFSSGTTISLGQGQGAIVYLTHDGASNPGNMTPIDSGNTYALQIQAGQATAVQQIQVITSNT